MVYTSPESMKYIKEWDKDPEVNFDKELPVAKRGRVGGEGAGGLFEEMYREGPMAVVNKEERWK